jgi:hypothetical protein
MHAGRLPELHRELAKETLLTHIAAGALDLLKQGYGYREMLEESETRVKFERPLDSRIMAIDGTWCRECLLIDVSESGALIKLTSLAADLTGFFLVLSSFGNYRRCKRASVHGPLIGLSEGRLCRRRDFEGP